MPKLSTRILSIIDELIDQYLEKDRYNRPWIIGFSGGKDSTVLLTLVWLALQKIREEKNATLDRQVYVVCNDTMVENPVIEEYVTTVLQTIQKAAKEQLLPVTVVTTTPQIEDTFWSCVIGKGYPVPNNSFRFCTEKMKIKPTSTFITNQVAADGEAIKIYLDASADDYECLTVVTNDSHRSCGQSRFGCWTCTVVKEDKSMNALIKNAA